VTSDRHEGDWVEQLPTGSFDLTEELGRWRDMRDAVVPADITGDFEKATAELAVSPLLDLIAKIGTRAPDFALPDAAGHIVSLTERLDQGPVVLSFYRGIWCPYCNLEQRALQQALPEITSLGASLIAISGMTPDMSLSMTERLNLTYDVLTDVGLSVADSYGLAWRLPRYLLDDYARLGHPIEKYNGQETPVLPIPATFAVHTDGIIRFAYAQPNYMYRADPADVIQVLRELA
jgi:peroxiredoxin